MKEYYLAESDGRKKGPLSKEKIIARLISGACSPNALVWCEGMNRWAPIGQVFAQELGAHQYLTGEKAPSPELGGLYYICAPGRDKEGPFSEKDIRTKMAQELYPLGSLVWCEGMPDWEPVEKRFRPRSPSPSSVLETAREAVGLSRLEGFSFKSFFGEIFRRHGS